MLNKMYNNAMGGIFVGPFVTNKKWPNFFLNISSQSEC